MAKVTNQEFVSLSEAADMVGAHRQTIFRYIKNGRLPAQMVGNQYIIDSNVLKESFKKCSECGTMIVKNKK